jgi:hypothetical protein
MVEQRYCVAIIRPLRERKARQCRKPVAGEVEGRKLCRRHLQVARRHAALRLQTAAAEREAGIRTVIERIENRYPTR